MNTEQISAGILEFLQSLTGSTDLTSTTDLQESGLIDSLTMMDLLVFIESEFDVRLGFEDLRPEIFASVTTLSALISERSGGPDQQKAA